MLGASWWMLESDYYMLAANFKMLESKFEPEKSGQEDFIFPHLLAAAFCARCFRLLASYCGKKFNNILRAHSY